MTVQQLQKTLLVLLFALNYFLVGSVSANTPPDDIRQLLQMTEYIAVDYSEAVLDGKIIDQGEYQEMLEFSSIISEKSRLLLKDEQRITQLATSLIIAVDNKQSLQRVQKITSELKQLLLIHTPTLSLPKSLFPNIDVPLAIIRDQLIQAEAAYLKNDFINAKQFAVNAYLDGFELIENTLDAHDKILRKSIESKLLKLRQELNKDVEPDKVKQTFSDIQAQLDKVEEILTGSSMSNATLFSASFIILLREGLEALLVVIALFTILVRSNKQEALKYVHFGWTAALVAGLLTWLTAEYLITISGASREIMEGVAAMLAAVVLFYVGFWMHSKTQADQWQLYIQRNISSSLKSGSLWGISGLAFIAVYREVFETVLFYQSLLTQTASSQIIVLISGFGFAVVVLMLFTWLMIKYSIKLPIGRFFSATTFILLALSFILAGKAVLALQEAAVIGIAPMPINFQIDLLGINSTWQGIGVQLSILTLSALLIVRQWLRTKSKIQPI